MRRSVFAFIIWLLLVSWSIFLHDSYKWNQIYTSAEFWKKCYVAWREHMNTKKIIRHKTRQECLDYVKNNK